MSNCIKKCIRDKKRVKRQQLIQRILKDFEGVSNIPRTNLQRRKCSLQRLKNEEKSFHHVNGLPMSLVNSTKIYTTTMSKTNMVMKAALTCTTTTPTI